MGLIKEECPPPDSRGVLQYAPTTHHTIIFDEGENIWIRKKQIDKPNQTKKVISCHQPLLKKMGQDIRGRSCGTLSGTAYLLS